mgnify:CR=1 FL=1
MHEPEIEYLIRSLGIGATYRGYEYLIYGIRLCLSDENYLLFVSKYLYPDIARHYNTTSYSVERDIRTVIKSVGSMETDRFSKNRITPFNSETNLR